MARLVTDSANSPLLRDALQWFVREKQWINEQHLQLCRIPSPTFFEANRAEWLTAQFQALGCIARLDRSGNVIAHPVENREGPLIALTAHLDTVWPRARAKRSTSARMDACTAPESPITAQD